MKVIFLDIDGVLNSETSIRANGITNQWNDNPHPEHIKWLNYIIKETGAKVVISSTWRTSASPSMFNRFLSLLGFEGDVIGRTPSLEAYRGTEIKTWLEEHADKIIKYKDSTWYSYKQPVDSFVILDDDSDMVDLTPYLVLIDGLKGLTEEDANKAIKILNKGVKK
jgi:hypothetical protein